MNPTKVKVDGEIFPINTDFRVALECNRISQSDVGEYEKTLAIVYKLYGEKGLKSDKIAKLVELGQKFLLLGKTPEEIEEKEEPDMDFNQDMDYIKASFMSDYKIDLENTKMHWWTFYNLINGLSDSEMGSCCVLNRVRNLRKMDISEIKDRKLREKVIKAKESVALNKKTITKEQEESIRRFEELTGIS